MITPEVRVAIRAASGSVRQIARQFSVNPKTVVKWRSSPAQVVSEPVSMRTNRALGEIEECRLVRYRLSSALALDDCLYASQSAYPWLTRSTLYRCFERFGVHRLSDLAVHRYVRNLSRIERLGVCSFYITRISTDTGPCDIHVMIDHATKLTLMRVYRPDDENALTDFRSRLDRCFPFPIRTVLLIEDSSSLDRLAAVIERVTGAGTRVEVLRQPLLVEPPPARNLAMPNGDTRNIGTLAETEGTIIRFLLDFNFSRKIKQIGGLRPSEAVHLLCGASPDAIREEADLSSAA